MKIIECCPFYNEHILLELKLEESSSWLNELHVSESDYTFKYDRKGYLLDNKCNRIVHKKINGERDFSKYYYGLKRSFPFFGRKSSAWKNEAFQRNYACSNLFVEDDDIVIFSDIDEIIDTRQISKLIDQVYQHEIITIPLVFSMFYMNLISTNWHEVWPGSPPDYKYRVFMMTGKYFKDLKVSSNELRRLGEGNKLTDSIYCYPDFAGYHHSWLGGSKEVYNKLNSYAHDLGDHGKELTLAYDEGRLDEYIKDRVENSLSIFPGHKLDLVPSEEFNFLTTVNMNKDKYKELIL